MSQNKPADSADETKAFSPELPHHDPIKELEDLVEEIHPKPESESNSKDDLPGVQTEGYDDPSAFMHESISIDIQIPSDKVGLIIGKGGKTIKYFQEKCGARMNIIQKTTSSDEYDKILRIVGPIQYVEHGRQLVHDLICNAKGYKPADSSDSSTNLAAGMRPRPKGLTPWKTVRYPVPKIAVGLIIGKGGETVRRIRMQTGAKVRFDPVGEKESDQQAAIVSGTSEQIRAACDFIDNMVSLALRGNQKQRLDSSNKEVKNFDEMSVTLEARCLTSSSSLEGSKSYGNLPLTPSAEHGTGQLYQHRSNVIEAGVEESRSIPCACGGSFQMTKQKVQNECGQGEPNNPCSIYTCGQSHQLNSAHFPNWLDYFQPERQQAQADAWEQQVKAEEQQMFTKKSCLVQDCNELKNCIHHSNAKPMGSSDGDGGEEYTENGPGTPVTTSQWSSEEFIPEKLGGDAPSAVYDKASHDKFPKVPISQTLLPVDDSRRGNVYQCQNPNCTQFSPLPVDQNANFPANSNCFYPVLSPSARIITFYYDINTNSVVVLNQWQCV